MSGCEIGNLGEYFAELIAAVKAGELDGVRVVLGQGRTTIDAGLTVRSAFATLSSRARLVEHPTWAHVIAREIEDLETIERARKARKGIERT